MAPLALVAVLSLLLPQSGPLVQGRPSFAGSWELDQEKSKAVARLTPGVSATAGPRMVLAIRQDAKSLTRTSGQATQVYELDGKPRQSTQGDKRTVTAKWVQQTVVIEVQTGDAGFTYVDRSTYSMDGDWLVITVESQSRSRTIVRKNYFKRLTS